jgi:cell wall-associated NlpC family hydrolase
LKSLSDWIGTLLSCDGIPYHHQGSSRFGCDCIGLPLLASRELGYDYSQLDRPDRLPDANDTVLLDTVASLCMETSEPEIGALILIQIPEWSYYRHCGIRIGEEIFIHADRDAGKVCLVPFRSAYTRSGLVRFFRMPFIDATNP